jgi:DNA-binding transcriptional ArsR family regulator
VRGLNRRPFVEVVSRRLYYECRGAFDRHQTTSRSELSLDQRQTVSLYLPLVQAYHHDQLAALGDPTRRAILVKLLEGPLPVGELARDFPISRPAISQHLRILKKADLVVDRPVGNRRVYAVNPAGIESLRAYFDRFWTRSLVAFKKAAEGKR